MDEATAQLEKLEKTLREKSSSYSTLEEEQDKIRKEITSHMARNGDLEERWKNFTDEADDLAGDIQSSTGQAVQAFRNPATLSSSIMSRLMDLGATLTRARLPKSVSSDFFEEVADEGECICGRPIGPKERAVLTQRKEQYLAQDQISAIATMKERLNSSSETETSFLESCEILQEKLEDRQVNEKAMARLKLEAEERGDDGHAPAQGARKRD